MLPQLDLLPPLGHKEAIGTLGYPIASKLEDKLHLYIWVLTDRQTPAFIIYINTGRVKVTNYILYFSLLNIVWGWPYKRSFEMSKKRAFHFMSLKKKWNMNGWVRKDNWVSTFLSVSQIHNNKIEYVQSVFDREKLKPPLESSILQAIFPSGLSYTHNHGLRTPNEVFLQRYPPN